MNAAPAPTAPVQPAARWAYQGTFVQPRNAGFWVYVIAIGIAGILVAQGFLPGMARMPTATVVSLGLLALYSIPVFVLIYVLDLFEREPRELIAAVLIWGGIGAIGFATVTNPALMQIILKVFGLEFMRDWGAAIVGPLMEEPLKFIGVYLIFILAPFEFDDLLDGFIYGALAGLGFAVVENLQYFLNGAAGSADQVAGVFKVFEARVIATGAYTHIVWSAMIGVGFAYFRTRLDVPYARRQQVFVGLFAAGIGAHILWNSPLFREIAGANPGLFDYILYGIVRGGPILLALVLLVRLAQDRERRTFKALVADDITSGSITPAEVATLGSLVKRQTVRREIAARKGPIAGKLQGQLQQAQINLALIRTRVQSPDAPDVVAQRAVIAAIRAQLAAIPDLPKPAPVPVPAPTPAPMPTAAQPLAAQPAPISAMPTPISAMPAWAPTHLVPATGQAAWDAPDPTRQPVVMLPAGLDLVIAERAGEWARVVASNGWTGWVDARLLQPTT